MRVTTYLHASKECMRDVGESAGLTEKALELFIFALYEVRCELEVDSDTGLAAIVSVNGRKLEDK